MNNINHSIAINAPASKVWDILWRDETYRKWTSAFNEGSHAVSDWKQGSSIHFVGEDGQGMYSVIETMDAPKTMVFKHLGVLGVGGEKLPPTPETEKWSGGLEAYYLSEDNGVTTLKVDSYAPPEFVEIFDTAFTKGFAIIKELSEN